MEPLPTYHQEDRPWGAFEQFTLNEPTTVKILRVEAGKRFSLQRHAHRTEFWKVIEGDGEAQIGDTTQHLMLGDSVMIPEGALHRLTGGEHGIRVLEIAFGAFDENDIERVEDDFGRSQP
jgi:mannose-6-phosphate isomerase-like protein (cupin superfamily)